MRHTAVLLLISAVSMSVYARTSQAGSGAENDSVDSKVEFIKTSSHPDVKEILQKDRPSETAGIPVPHFAVRTADNKFVLTIGGQINPILGADFGNDLYEVSGAGIGFVTSMIPVPPVNGKKSDF